MSNPIASENQPASRCVCGVGNGGYTNIHASWCPALSVKSEPTSDPSGKGARADLAENLATAVQEFRNLPQLGELGALRKTKEYDALCNAWFEYACAAYGKNDWDRPNTPKLMEKRLTGDSGRNRPRDTRRGHH